MAPRRNSSVSVPSALDVQNLFGLDELDLHDDSTTMARCCVPNTECLKSTDFGLINLDDLTECIRVVCSNELCSMGNYMHRECFDAWELTVLNYLKSIGRARSWTEKQRSQNLWTKKGYELAFNACSCKCGRGHLKKDLDWLPPQNSSLFRIDEDGKANNNNQKGNNKKKRSRTKLSLAPVQTGGGQKNILDLGGMLDQSPIRPRANSLTSSNGSSSPPVSSSEQSVSPVHSAGNNLASNLVGKNSGRPLTPKSMVELYSERVRATSGANGIFSRRLDFSSFNILPKQRINSYAVKIEDEGNHGNDETRLFILSSLAAQHKSRTACVLCEEPMLVFDRYPLVDGTFFLSPRKHANGCIEVKYENRIQYLTSVCMACLEGVSAERVVRCRFCANKWDGSSLVLGTMYSYDIFAAMPCCTERLKCNNCFKLLLHPHQRLSFYSDYSHSVSCPYCTSQDTHFVKPLSYCYTKQPLQCYQQWP